MIRKWLKINTCFIEILKSSSETTTLDKKWTLDIPGRQYLGCCSPLGALSRAIPSASAGALGRFLPLARVADPNEKGDAESGLPSEGEEEEAVAETPARTELFEVRGPGGAAFLVEVRGEDLEEVRGALGRLKGDLFRFDPSAMGGFTVKCVLAGRREGSGGSDDLRLAKVHAISSGSEEVYLGMGKFFFVNSIERTMRAKRILEKLGYKISGILYRFQPKEKPSLDEEIREVCARFVEAVERLPKVISVTHNL